jgi:hypothetical protein
MEFLQLLASLRTVFAACAVVGVTAAVSSVIWLNGGIGPFQSVGAAMIACVSSAILAFFMLGARWNLSIRKLVLRPDASMPHVTLGLDFFGWVSALFALGFLATTISVW